MKRLWLAAAILAFVAGSCAFASFYQHHKIDQLLTTLDQLETVHTTNPTTAQRLANQLISDYTSATKVLYCYMAHSDLAESQETVALLPALLQNEAQEELKMEIARLREQLRYLREIDDPLWRNIL